MSYDANAHTTQMAILKQLLLAPNAGFAQLQKAADVTSDFANFHIKQLMSTGYVRKDPVGKYVLTKLGKEYANRMDTEQNLLEKQAKLSVWLVVDDGKGKFLAQQRLKQPYYGYWGRLGGKIRWGETIVEAAARELKEETDLTANFEFKGIYHKTDYNKAGELLEDKFFYLVHATNPKGTLKVEFDGGLNQWMTDEEFKAKDKYFESALQATSLATKPGLQFVEKKHIYEDDDY